MASTDQPASSTRRIDRILELIDQTLDEVTRSAPERPVTLAEVTLLTPDRTRAA